MDDSHTAAGGLNGPSLPVHDVVGIGFGPSNLALAVAGRERGLSDLRFFERSPAFAWHRGMMIDGARMQISFLKDLATLHDPASEFTFLQYLKARGRLESFMNLRDFYPTRVEFHDYLTWASDQFAAQVEYGTEVTRVSLWPSDASPSPLFCLDLKCAATGEVRQCLARNVVNAPGGSPRLPDIEVCDSPRVFHSSEFLRRLGGEFRDRLGGYEFAVVGGGQSAGEIAAHLLEAYPSASVRMLINDYALRPADDSPFVNQQFQSHRIDEFHQLSAASRQRIRAELHNSNYAVMEPEIIDRLHRHAYDGEVVGRSRFGVHPYSELCQVKPRGDRLEAVWRNRSTLDVCRGEFDGLVFATGYVRKLDERIFADVIPYIRRDELGDICLTAAHRVETSDRLGGGLYVQGLGEHSFGISDSLLSALPFTAHAILRDIRSAEADCAADLRHIPDYPPRRHVEDDPDLAYGVMQTFPFATVISVSQTAEPMITHAPLVLDRTRGAKGVLFGHMDRANPQVALLNGPVTLCFNGPNAYISPTVYTTDQLPTWNSISVHVRGVSRVLVDQAAVVKGLCSICETADRAGYRLDPNDPRIDKLIDYIVGFEVEIHEVVARFKLSQDRTSIDRGLAATELLRHVADPVHGFVQTCLGPTAAPAPSVTETERPDPALT